MLIFTPDRHGFVLGRLFNRPWKLKAEKCLLKDWKIRAGWENAGCPPGWTQLGVGKNKTKLQKSITNCKLCKKADSQSAAENK